MIVDGRQVSPTIAGIRADHVSRYAFAIGFAKAAGLNTATDIGAGIGYGAWMMADSGIRVVAIEREVEASKYGQEHYQHANLMRVQNDLMHSHINSCDMVTAFEVIEHIEGIDSILSAASKAAKYLVCSVPNEDVIPFSQNRHHEHVRHYTAGQFADLLQSCGWAVEVMGSQKGKAGKDAEVSDNTKGRSLVCIARSLCV
jgi:tRNA1(Val) A37 N6-methylase TrmN6